MALGLFLVGPASRAANRGAEDDAQALAAHLSALKDTHTLQARFICEKRLALLETPLVSSGMVWIRKAGEKKEQGDSAVRFTTEKPYVSDLILTPGKIFARSQHEAEWTKSNQSGRPGLTAVMGQLAAWSTGDGGKIADMYSVKQGNIASIERRETTEAGGGTTAGAASRPTDVFILTPTNKDLAKAIKEITLTIDRATHHLVEIEIRTQQDDVTRYSFLDVKTNGPLPADIFTPDDRPVPPASAPAGEKG